LNKEPKFKRAFVYFDGQNLFHHAKEAFGYNYPNFDPRKLADNICKNNSWVIHKTFFYTGIPSLLDKPFWHNFWKAKMQVMGTRGIKTFSRELRYRNEIITLQDGNTCAIQVGQEKGIDIRIALDIVRHALTDLYDVALVFSQDQDLTEAVDDVKSISQTQKRWIKIASAFPISATVKNKRGINKTEWITIDRATYDNCIDPIDYRPKTAP